MSSHGGPFLQSGVRTQAAALFYKNAVQQRRAWATNCFIIVTPVLVCVFLVLLQTAINHAFSGAEYRVSGVKLTMRPAARASSSSADPPPPFTTTTHPPAKAEALPRCLLPAPQTEAPGSR